MDGRVVRALPDRPLRPSELRSLNNCERMEVLAVEGKMSSPFAHGLALQTESWYYGLGYDEKRGWCVFERLSRSLPDGREKVQAVFDEWVDDSDPVRTDRPF